MEVEFRDEYLELEQAIVGEVYSHRHEDGLFMKTDYEPQYGMTCLFVDLCCGKTHRFVPGKVLTPIDAKVVVK